MLPMLGAGAVLAVAVATGGQTRAASLELLAPPDQVTLSVRQGMPIAFTWRAAGESSYRFQLAQDRAFSKVIVDKWVAGTSSVVRDLPSGVYYWRCSPDGASWKQVLSLTVLVRQRSSQ